jgi:hypothetical protein
VKMWARLTYQDGLFKMLGDLADVTGAGATVAKLLALAEDIAAGRGTWTIEQLRKVAKIRRFIKPLRHVLKLLNKVAPYVTAADLAFGGRFVSGYLVMTYEDPFDTHYAWEVDMVLKGPSLFTEGSGSFTTSSDSYSLRTSVFNPELWREKELTCAMTGSSFSMSIQNAFKKAPHAGKAEERPFAGPAVFGSPGVLDWQLKLKPLHSLGGGLAFFHTLDIKWFGIDWFDAKISNGAKRSFGKIMSV